MVVYELIFCNSVAWQFTKFGKIFVKFKRILGEDRAIERLEVTVEDTGEGIPDDKLSEMKKQFSTFSTSAPGS